MKGRPNEKRPLCEKVWGPVVHGAQHWCKEPLGHQGDCCCPCGNRKLRGPSSQRRKAPQEGLWKREPIGDLEP